MILPEGSSRGEKKAQASTTVLRPSPGETEQARRCLTAAVALRERLGHAGLADSRAALAALGG
jgi:hypothetical protein